MHRLKMEDLSWPESIAAHIMWIGGISVLLVNAYIGVLS